MLSEQIEVFLKESHRQAMAHIQGYGFPHGNLDLAFCMTQALGEMMSSISESAYAAHWYSGIEDTLPPAARKMQTRCYAGSRFAWDMTPAQAKAMRGIADYLGHWARYDGEHDCFMPYVPKSESKGAYKPKNSSRMGEV